MAVVLRLQRRLANDKAELIAVTCDLFGSESSLETGPQLSELHGFRMVPTKVVENGQTQNWSAWARMSS